MNETFNQRGLRRRSFVQAMSALLGTGLSMSAFAADQRTCAVLSMVGDQLTAVRFQPSIGSSLDRNEKREIPASGMDAAIARAVADAIKQAQPSTSAIPFQASDSRLLALDDPKRIADLLRGDLEKMRSTHLLVLTKVRHPTRLKVGQGSVGAGKLTGMGFYEDRMEYGQSTGGVLDHGFFATYVYAKASLVDLTTGQVRDTQVIESQVWAALAVPDNLDPWTVLSPAARLDDLRELAQRTLSAAAVKLISA